MCVLQTAGSIKGPKWESRARLEVYLGPSLTHARSVGLALSLQSGLVSPVYHAKYDDTFSTVRDPYGKYITKSKWQLICGFQQGVIREPWIEPTSVNPIDAPNIEPTMPDTTTLEPAQTNLLDGTTPTSELQTAEIPTTNNNMSQVDTNEPTVTTTRSGRQVRRPAYLVDYKTSNITSIDNQRVETTVVFTDTADPIALNVDWKTRQFLLS
jgi:hypothetical protein